MVTQHLGLLKQLFGEKVEPLVWGNKIIDKPRYHLKAILRGNESRTKARPQHISLWCTTGINRKVRVLFSPPHEMERSCKKKVEWNVKVPRSAYTNQGKTTTR